MMVAHVVVNPMTQAHKAKVLFLCTGNSCRSQMAEGWARWFHSDCIDAFSAGTIAQGLNLNAVFVMAEEGVDISHHQSKRLVDLDMDFDYVITVCGNAQASCPIFPGKAKVIHYGFDDPPALAKGAASEQEALEHYRRVSKEVRDWVKCLPQILSIR